MRQGRYRGLAVLLMLTVTLCAIGGVSLASPKKATTHHKRKQPAKTIRGPRGFRGPAGSTGPQGAAGANGTQGVPGSARAYAFIKPICNGCGEQAAGSEVLESAYSRNVSLGTPQGGAPTGTWCFTLGAGIDPSSALLVVSPVVNHALTEYAQVGAMWVPHAPSCSPGQVEVQAVGYEIKEGKLVSVPSKEVAFSFIVP